MTAPNNPAIPANVQMQAVSNSSNVEYVGYDPQAKDLYITFKGGSTYRYAEVPVDTWRDLQNAPSVGKFIHANIKGIYKSERLGPKPD